MKIIIKNPRNAAGVAQNVEHDIQASHAQSLINNVLTATESITLPNTAGQKISTRYHNVINRR